MKEHFGDDVEEDSHINQSPNYKVFDIIMLLYLLVSSFLVEVPKFSSDRGAATSTLENAAKKKRRQ